MISLCDCGNELPSFIRDLWSIPCFVCFSAGGLLLHPVCADTVECVEQYVYVLCILVYHWICAMSKVGTVFSMTCRSGRAL